MEIKDQKDPIKNDQFGDAESTPVTPENKETMPLEQPNGEEAISPQTESKQKVKASETKKKKPKSVKPTKEETPVKPAKAPKVTKEKVASTPVKEEVKLVVNETVEEKPEEKPKEKRKEKDDKVSLTKQDKKEESIPEDEEDLDDELDSEEEDEDDESDQLEELETVDYSQLSREELVDRLSKLLGISPIKRIRSDIESIKINFYKKHKAEFERKRKEWIEAGGDIEEFEAPVDPMEPQIKELLKQYRDIKSTYNRDIESQKLNNLEVKQALIEQIKDLVNRNESVNQTFQDFRELQQKWREVGPVPQANLNDLWETYHHHVQNFYDYVKINKELKDLDLRRNLEEKIILCEKAEELLLESSIVTAFKKLQKLHNQWREIGPVPNEHRTEIWERFKEVTTSINKKHQEHFEGLREDQKANLEAKKALSETAEELAAKVINSAKEWNKYSKEMIELQKVWKTIGFAPKKDNNKIYERFRLACDAFFNSKREFYQDAREDQLNNLQLKTDLCIQAEALKESNEWKRTTEELINLQKRWKQIGPVPRKQSDEVWKRFRATCDMFFERKSKHFATVDTKYEANLKAKEDLIAEILNFEVSTNVEECLKSLKDFQRRWAEIGFVPIKKKDELQKNYREAINKHFENLKIDNSQRNILKFKTKIDTIQGNHRMENKMRFERDKLFNQLKQLENDIVLWENNIGFFTKSKNAEQLIKDVERKIEKARTDMKMIEEKIRIIDNMDQA
jgi:hypothetical protein